MRTSRTNRFRWDVKSHTNVTGSYANHPLSFWCRLVMLPLPVHGCKETTTFDRNSPCIVPHRANSTLKRKERKGMSERGEEGGEGREKEKRP